MRGQDLSDKRDAVSPGGSCPSALKTREIISENTGDKFRDSGAETRAGVDAIGGGAGPRWRICFIGQGKPQTGACRKAVFDRAPTRPLRLATLGTSPVNGGGLKGALTPG